MFSQLIFAVLSLFCCIYAAEATKKDPKIYVLFGPSQAGKSAFVNTLSGQVLAIEGDGSGISQTSACEEYAFEVDGEPLVVLDVPGLNDNLQLATNEEIMYQIKDRVTNQMAAVLLETSGKSNIDGVLIFEPLDMDSTQVDRTLMSACMLFGSDVLRSSLVIMTKGDLDYARKSEAAPIPSVQWIKTTDKHILTGQLEDLRAKLLNLDAYEVENMENILDEVKVLARESCSNQPQEFLTVQIPVTQKVQSGTCKVITIVDKEPVQLFKDEQFTVQVDVLARSAVTFASLKSSFIARYLSAFDGICPRNTYRKWVYSSDASHVIPEISEVSGLCATVYMADHTNKTPEMLRKEFLVTWPYGGQEKVMTRCGHIDMYIHRSLFEKIVMNSKDLGCGVNTYRKETRTQTRKVPFWHTETVEVVKQEPVYENRVVMEEQQVVRPPRPEDEFMHDAREALAKRLRESIVDTK